ncbi:alkaline phosphatase family protein [Actinomyces howellii]|uniref:Type I phosphodiesterase / nucleotide pyrophosphatase n=1 Tax=Actinomyces howellii TaxID=52771 RepID=A0A3S4T8P4_9ACTO|nr:alkaline phosphatase family protein [Actinomyces howellii]VEG26425.1 Type I phosphodiesterase / nucleotide pyrophosphatase [Actinomyces howellii]
MSAGTDPSLPELRQVLGAAAVSAGLSLADGPQGALTDAQARRAARAWGLDDPTTGAGTVVVLVDGLGLVQLRERRGHAPRLRSWLSQAEAAGGPGPAAVTCLPSTTAAALTTLGTGAGPGLTGMVGYSVLNPLLGRDLPAGTVPSGERNLCLITWEGQAPDPRAWQDVPTIFERVEADPASGTRPTVVSVGPSRFAGSGLTQAGLRGATHVGVDRLEDRPAAAAQALRRGTPLVYLYVGELDHAGHAHGWRSATWLEQLERLDAAMTELLRRVPGGTRVVLTADHGMVDTDESLRIEVTAHPSLARDVVAVAGEPRFTQLHVPGSDPDTARQVADRWRAELGERALWVGTRDQAHEMLGPVGPRAHGVLGDVLVAMAGRWVVVDPRVHSPGAMAMPGVHGSSTEAETIVPLLVAQA